uniref:Uncharacterized protein n=1 Tax=Arundo donax TaxID=35708 RepID=A0A0A9HB65_ARUDO
MYLAKKGFGYSP